MKNFRDVYKTLKVEEAVNEYTHKARVQGRWVRLQVSSQVKKQFDQVEELIQVPQSQLKKISDTLHHDVGALKKFYEAQRKEIQRLGRNFRKNGSRFLVKSKILSTFANSNTQTASEENDTSAA